MAARGRTGRNSRTLQSMVKVLESVEKMIGKHLSALAAEDILSPLTTLSVGDSVRDYNLGMFRLRFLQSIS